MLGIPLKRPVIRRIRVIIGDKARPDTDRWWILLGGIHHHITGASSYVRAYVDASGIPIFVEGQTAGTASGDYALLSNLAGSLNNAYGLQLIDHNGYFAVAGGAGAYADLHILEVDQVV